MQFLTIMQRMAAKQSKPFIQIRAMNFSDTNNLERFFDQAMRNACSKPSVIVISGYEQTVSEVKDYLRAVLITRRWKREKLHTNTVIMFDKDLKDD